MRTIFALSLAAALALVALPPVASAGTCTSQEVVYLGTAPDVTVTLFTCSHAYYWEVDPMAVQQGPVCQSVPPVRVLGEDVPGTGDDACSPPAGEDPEPVGHGEQSPWAYVVVQVGEDRHETPLFYYATTCWIGFVAAQAGVGNCWNA